MAFPTNMIQTAPHVAGDASQSKQSESNGAPYWLNGRLTALVFSMLSITPFLEAAGVPSGH